MSQIMIKGDVQLSLLGISTVALETAAVFLQTAVVFVKTAAMF